MENLDPMIMLTIAVAMPSLMMIGGVMICKDLYLEGRVMSDNIVIGTGLIVISLALYFKYFN